MDPQMPGGARPSQKIIDFNAELKAILDKYQFDIGAVTWITEDGRIAAKPQVFDRTPNKPAPDAKPAKGSGAKLMPATKAEEEKEKGIDTEKK